MSEGATTDGQKREEGAIAPDAAETPAPAMPPVTIAAAETLERPALIEAKRLVEPELIGSDFTVRESTGPEFTGQDFTGSRFTMSGFSEPVLPPVIRTPNFADAMLFMLMLVIGFLAAAGMASAATHNHWFGLHSLAQAQGDTRLALATQALIYGVALACAVPFFRLAWGKGLLTGLHWHAHTARRLRFRLLGTAVICNVIAMLGNALLPFPQHAPIDKMFSTSTDAWLLMAFGITVAPFFEEMAFRGFLLPAMATAWDWFGEWMSYRTPRPLDAEGNPQWSPWAMIFAALTVSAPFALMHAEQVGNAWGPVLLLYCVSLILCAVRLVTRSLAASTLVHASYNFMLFAVMFAETDGFRHMDKM